MFELVSAISLWMLAGLIGTILIWGLVKRVPLYESFVEGAKDGFGTSIDLIPHLVGMLVAVTVFRESGALDYLISLLSPLAQLLFLPQEVLPLAIIRPISGSGALAITTDLIQTHGPDSFIGRLASTMHGSSDTTLYVLAVYFGAVGIRKSRYALKVGLLADAMSVVSSLFFVWLVFG